MHDKGWDRRRHYDGVIPSLKLTIWGPALMHVSANVAPWKWEISFLQPQTWDIHIQDTFTKPNLCRVLGNLTLKNNLISTSTATKIIKIIILL